MKVALTRGGPPVGAGKNSPTTALRPECNYCRYVGIQFDDPGCRYCPRFCSSPMDLAAYSAKDMPLRWQQVCKSIRRTPGRPVIGDRRMKTAVPKRLPQAL